MTPSKTPASSSAAHAAPLSVPASLALLLAGMLIAVPLAAQGQTVHTWQGTTADLATGSNWSNGVVPSAGGTHQMIFDGSGTINATTFPGGTFSGNPGLGDITITGDQTEALSFINVGGAGSVFRLANDSSISIAAGAGAVTFGDGGNAFFLNLGQAGAGNQFINNSANTATIAAPVTINASAGTGGLAIFDGTGDWLISATISSALTRGVTMNGSGTVTLTAANAYTGATNVNAGTLVYQNTYASTSHTIASGAVLELNVASGSRNSATTTFSGDGTLRKTGDGQILWGASSATFALGAGGLIDVQGGTFTGGSNANENWTNNQASLNVAAGALFNGVEANVRVGALTGDGTIRTGWSGAGYSTFTFGLGDASGTFSGTLSHNNGVAWGNYTKVGTGTQTFTGTINQIANGGGVGMTISAGTVEIGGAGTFDGGSWSNALVNNGTFHYNSTANNTMTGVISGTGDLVKSNSGILTLSGNNSYSGETIINQGTIRLGNNNALGSTSAGTTINAAGTLDINGSSIQGEAITLNGGTITNTGGQQTNALRFVTLTADSTFAGTGRFDVRGGGGVLALNGHTLTINNSNKVSIVDTSVTGGGVIDLTAGTLGLTRSGGAGSFAGTTIKVGPGATLDFENNSSLSSYQANLELSSATVLVRGNAASLTGSITLEGNNTFDTSATFTASGQISGTGGLTKTGGGVFYVDGNNSYSGATNVEAGYLVLRNSGALGNSPTSTVASGATLQLESNSTVTGNHATISGTGVGGTRGALASWTGNNTWGGNVTLAADSSIFVNSGSFTISGVIDGAHNLTKTGAGSLTLTNANTYTGTTTVSASTLVLENNLAIQNSALVTTGAGTIHLGAGVTTPTIGGLSGATGDLATVISSGYSNVTALTLNPQAGVSVTYGGVIPDGAAGMTLTITGDGTQVLTGNNSYSGGTTVAAGTLLVNNTTGSGTGTGGVTVQSGATLGGTGFISGPTLVNSGGILSPGNSGGTLGFGSGLSLDPGAIFFADILFGGSDTDLAQVAGGVSIGGAMLDGTWGGGSDNLFRGTYSADNMFWLINNQGQAAIDGRFANTTTGAGFAHLFGNVTTPDIVSIDGQLFAAFYESQFGEFSIGGLTGGNDFLLIAIPEPSRAMLFALGALALLARRRR